MLDHDILQKHAANIMAHLEDASLAAMEIQSRDKTLTGIAQEFKTIRIELRAIDNILSKVDVLMANSNSQ